MASEQQVGLHAAVLRQTALDRTWLGYWLKRHQDHEKLDPVNLAEKLGLTMENFVLLCLCKTPRADQFRDDVSAICRRTGVRELNLVRLLRQEQNIEMLQQSGSAPETGWLMAALDHTPESEETPPTTESTDD